MANVGRGNIHYVDSTGDLRTANNVKVAYILLTPTSANAVLLLSDPSDNNAMEFRWAGAGESKLFNFHESPLLFPNGVKAKTVTNCVATIVYTGGSNR